LRGDGFENIIRTFSSNASNLGGLMTQTRLTRLSFVVVFTLFCGCEVGALFEQSPTPPSLEPSPTPTPLMQSQTGDPDRYLRDGLKGIAEESRNLIGWGLTIIGASVIAIASSSYFRPPSKRVRLTYLLFIPGWLLIGLSIRNGEKVSRRFAAAAFAQRRDTLLQIGDSINNDFGSQLTCMQWGLGFFSLWLLAFIVWWVFGDVPTREK
jgi:hypothetical protein